ncbi:ABC transporter ATP-binding protein [Acidisphaera sp. L21]|uniref:ABC transporter ATP-binding protein n=1 Tax=Acidisphaera sp. L21 TaxID=1641851 RepID=UPI0020B16F8E|nr:ABC transporter ATP-binding protein [Acidisphaera sp. L21]
MLLEVRDLRTGYGAVEVVHGISFELAAGSMVGLIGANGAGKSGAMHAICGLLRHTGAVLLDGQDLARMSAHDRARAGLIMVPEGRRVFPGMSVRDNLLSASLHRRVRGRAQQTLDTVFHTFPRLQERLNQAAETLSGGEQQMLAIGRTMMGQPRVMVLDEPSLGLSPLFVQEVFRVIGALRETGLTILLVEQNVHHCLELSDYAYVLEQGHIVLQGAASDLLVDPRVRAAYLGTSNQPSEAEEVRQ